MIPVYHLLQEEGLESFLEYLKGLIEARAEEDYSALVEGAGASIVHLSLSRVLLGFLKKNIQKDKLLAFHAQLVGSAYVVHMSRKSELYLHPSSHAECVRDLPAAANKLCPCSRLCLAAPVPISSKAV